MKREWIDIHTHRPTRATTIRTVGVHPWQVATASLPTADEIDSADAVGEIGLDRACAVPFELQKQRFIEQLALAEEHQKPVVLHVVRAFEEVMQCLAARRLPAVIFHGFIGSLPQAARALQRGYYLSFGLRSLRSPKSLEVLQQMPLDRLFIETDKAETAIEALYTEVAVRRNIPLEELQEAICKNYQRIFAKQ